MDKDDRPIKLKRPFLKKEEGFIKKETIVVEEPKEFMLVLMMNSGYTDFIENVKPGEFFLKSQDGKEEKSIILTPKSLTTFKYNKQYIKGWVAHEDNMSPYPQDPLHNGEMLRKLTQKISMNYRDVNEAKFMEARTKMILTVSIVVIIGLYVLYIVSKNAGWIGGDDVVVTSAVSNAGKSVIDIANSTGTTI